MERLCRELTKSRINYVRECPLERYNTFRIKSAAEVAVFPENKQQMIRVLSLVTELEIPHATVGKGSNLLVPDGRYNGAVIFTGGLFSFSFEDNRATVGAGLPLPLLAVQCRSHGLGGAEFAVGIPGTVGGAVLMNAGAFGQEMSQIVRATEYWDASDATCKTLVGAEHCFGKRESYFSSRPELTILSVQMEFPSAPKDEIVRMTDDFIARRRNTQPLGVPNAGSIFKHPEGMFAGRIIDGLGLKGTRVGDAEVSTKHAGFIVNRGSATETDVLGLIELIRERVRRDIGVELECELRRLDGKKI